MDKKNTGLGKRSPNLAHYGTYRPPSPPCGKSACEHVREKAHVLEGLKAHPILDLIDGSPRPTIQAALLDTDENIAVKLLWLDTRLGAADKSCAGTSRSRSRPTSKAFETIPRSSFTWVGVVLRTMVRCCSTEISQIERLIYVSDRIGNVKPFLIV